MVLVCDNIRWPHSLSTVAVFEQCKSYDDIKMYKVTFLMTFSRKRIKDINTIH